MMFAAHLSVDDVAILEEAIDRALTSRRSGRVPAMQNRCPTLKGCATAGPAKNSPFLIRDVTGGAKRWVAPDEIRGNGVVQDLALPS